MGMLIDGAWDDTADRFMQGGAFQREQSQMPTNIDNATLSALREDRSRFVLVASNSCPWSHGAVLAMVISGLHKQLPLQLAGGVRIEGYTLLPDGPLSAGGNIRFIHQLYTKTDPQFTGRATVPVFWDRKYNRILSNSSVDIVRMFDQAGQGPSLYPEPLRAEIDALTGEIYHGLSNMVYRAGLAELQDEYDKAVGAVFDTMDMLEERLSVRQYLFGQQITEADIRLFATLVRFDTVYATHFRCTRKRFVDYENLWRFTRRIYQSQGIRDTIDFDEIRFGYYANDGNHNPHGIIGQQPDIDWEDNSDL